MPELIHGTAAAAAKHVTPVNIATMVVVHRPIMDHILPIAMIQLLMFLRIRPIAVVVAIIVVRKSIVLMVHVIHYLYIQIRQLYAIR